MSFSMVTNTEGYIHIVEYLTHHLDLFEHTACASNNGESVMEVIEQELSTQVIAVCSQNEALTFNQRNAVIREVDAILYDLEEILSAVVNNPVTMEQAEFLHEWAMLIKNLFDTEVHRMIEENTAI